MQKTSLPCAPRHLASKKSTAAKLFAAIAALTLAAAPAAHAANDLWVGNTDTDFSTSANWTGSVSPNGITPEFGVAGTSGTTLTNDLTGASFVGLTFDSGASAFTIGGNSFNLTGDITNNSSSTQTINNAMTLTASRVLNATSGQLVLGGNITASQNLTLNPTNKITLAGTNTIAVTATGTNTFYALLVNAGAGGVDITGSTTVGPGGAMDRNGTMAVSGTTTVTVQSGGSLTINGSGTSTTTWPNTIIGQNTAGTSTLLVNGGTLTVGANSGFVLGNGNNNNIASNGVLTISSGTATINRGTAGAATSTDTRLIEIARDSTSATGTINLNGGTLATDRQFVRDGSSVTQQGTANFVFGGGTLKALGNQTDWLQSTTATSGGQGGGTVNASALALSSVTTTAVSTIDSNGFSVGINSAISGVGGFHIISSSGSGTVNFGGSAYTYTGATSVDSGTLNMNVATSALAGNLAIAGGQFANNGTSAGALTLAAGKNFTMTLGTLSYSLGDTITGSGAGTFGISGGTLDLTSSISNYGIAYSLLNGFTSGSVSGLSITGYDTADYIASLSNAGVLTFSAIPEPSTYTAILGVLALGVVIARRRLRVRS